MMKITRKATNLLMIINIHQIVTGVICFILLVHATIENMLGDKNMVFELTYLFLTALSVLLVYLNLYLIVKKEKSVIFISIVAWFNFSQIFYISIMGFTYYLLFGSMIMPFFNYSDGISFGLHLNLFVGQLGLKWKYDDKIIFGINLIPLTIFILLSWIQKEVIIENYVSQIE